MTIKTKTPTAKIIIVDDSNTIRSVLRSLLASEGHEILDEYSSGRKHTDDVAETEPNINYLAYNLPAFNCIHQL